MGGYVYVGAADWGGKEPAKCNRGLYRLDTHTGSWASLEKGLPENVEARCVAFHSDKPDELWVGTQDGPYRSDDAGETWKRIGLPDHESVVWRPLAQRHGGRKLEITS